MAQTSVLNIKGFDPNKSTAIGMDEDITMAAEAQAAYGKEPATITKTIPQVEKSIAKVKKDMEKAARDMDFMEAARLRDQMFKMQKELEGMKA